MRFELIRCSLAAVLLLGLGGASATRAQESAPPAEPTAAPPESPPEGEFFESIDVNVVNVDVFVTDKKGNRIRGLGADDFDLFEDGKPVAITNFYAVEDGRPAVVESDSVTGVVEPGQPVPAPAPAPLALAAPDIPEEQRLHVVVYIDNWNIKPFNRNRVFAGLRQFLRNELSAGDRVMLVTYERSRHIRRPFTSDPVTIASALFELERLSANGQSLERDRREMLERIRDPSYSGGTGSLTYQARNYAQALYSDLSFTIDSLKETVTSLSGLPGRKAVIYVSDGLEMVAGEDIFHAVQEATNDMQSGLLMESRQFDLSRRYLELVSTANSSRVAFYNIDASGLRAPSAGSAEYRSSGTSTMVDSIYFSNLVSSLLTLSDGTGGITIRNTNDPAKGLVLIAEDFKNYYSLGYSPSTLSTGRYRKLEVRTKDKSLVVRHREGFRDKSVEARMADGVQAALNFDYESNPLGVVVDRGDEQPRSDGNYLVPISVRIPIGKLTLLPTGALHVARAKLFVAVMDDKGWRSEVSEARVPIEIDSDKVADAQQGYWRYDLNLVMRGGVQRLAVGLRDELGQVSSFAVKTIGVGR
jgi:VWFA-related protein